MAGERKKTVLYSDLFKNMDMSLKKEEEDDDENINVVSSKVEGRPLPRPTSNWISSSNQSSSSTSTGSSSSGFSTPLYSDLESDNGDFIAELTRQMAECMLQEEDEEEEAINTVLLNYVSKESAGPAVKNKEDQLQIYTDYGFKSGPGPVCVDDRIPPIQVYELKDQPQEGHFCRERGGVVKGAESAQQKTTHHRHHYKQQHKHKHKQYYRSRREIEMGRNNGSGMQAVFLGESGSGWTSESPAGTGVFLPPAVTADPTQAQHLNKKSAGRSIVLMPTRVLQALELHFKQRHYSMVPPLRLSGRSLINKDERTTSNGDSQLEKRAANSDEIQLPQEWTY